MRASLAAVVSATFVACILLVPARATYRAHTTADEPQYLITARSLATDGDLDISDDLVGEEWRAWHEIPLSEQTRPLSDGRRLSPHDPMLSVLLAPAMALPPDLGWVAAKATLAAIAATLAGLLVWVAVRRFAVPPGRAAVVVGGFAVTAPLGVYGTQVYPEIPAALAVTAAVAALTAGPRLAARHEIVVVVAVVALPWLSVKYVAVAAVLAGLGLWRGSHRAAMASVLLVAGVVYLGAHRLLYEGWTVYAAGDHFVGGEATVVGTSPDYLGRTERLWGLLVDRQFGLAAWAPAWLFAVPAVASMARRRPAGAGAVLGPLAAGWSVATFVALTMHGWWWPGRQVVVVLPLAVLAVAWWVRDMRLLGLTVALHALGAITLGWVGAGAVLGHHTLIVDFTDTSAPTFGAWQHVLPDHRAGGWANAALDAVWIVGLGGLALAGWRTTARSNHADPDPGGRRRPRPHRLAGAGGVW